MNKVKRLLLDIETSLSVAATFSLWPKHISHNNILQNWHIICAAWKWEGSEKVYSKKTYTSDDKKVVKALCKAISKADELVYHNGRKFDFKKINTRVLVHGLPPLHKPRETDTLLQARRHFSFTSNRLDYLGQMLVEDQKLSNPPNLWMDVLRGDKKAVDQMDEYCKQDVNLLEKIFQTMKPHIECGFNAALLYDKPVCPTCESKNSIKYGMSHTKAATYQKHRCTDCLAVFRDGSAIKRQNPVVRK